MIINGMADLNLGIIHGVSMTVHIGNRFASDKCGPNDLRDIARTLRIIADTVERGRRPRTAKAPVELKSS